MSRGIRLSVAVVIASPNVRLLLVLTGAFHDIGMPNSASATT
jgi:hypothetical protein